MIFCANLSEGQSICYLYDDDAREKDKKSARFVSFFIRVSPFLQRRNIDRALRASTTVLLLERESNNVDAFLMVFAVILQHLQD